MARKANTFVFTRTTSRYPWDEWLDGDTWSLKIGEDFQVELDTFRSSAQNAAKSRGGKVRTQVKDDKLFIQFYTD